MPSTSLPAHIYLARLAEATLRVRPALEAPLVPVRN